MLRSMTWPKRITALQIALAISIGVHAFLLVLRIVDPEGFNQLFDNTPLEVVLVNARSDQVPDKAMALAQANLAGGGDAEQGLATSPLPPQPSALSGDAPEETHQRIEQLQQQQDHMLAELRRELAALPFPDPNREAGKEQARSDAERKRQLLDLLAAIEKRINEENARPKKRFVGPSTRESSEALYYDQFRRKVERAGTDNFPTANGKKLYGELVMLVWLDKRGRLVSTEVAQSSGSAALDKRAAAIVRKAGPFGTVPARMRQQADLWAIASRFKFSRDDGVEARPMQSAAQ